MKSVRVCISGRVQGVWFRGWTIQEARRLSLTGWVRNCSDGSVEAVFCGAAADVDVMLEMCLQGPSAARVERVQATPTDDPGVEGFGRGVV